MKRARTFGLAVVAVSALFAAGPAWGVTFAEIADAPSPLPGLPTMGVGPLDRIYGVLADSADVDAYQIQVINPAAFSATVVGGAAFDTQLFLFRISGAGITHDDDTPPGGVLQSTITGAFLPGPGLYVLAISAFDRDPTNPAANLIWLSDPVNLERAPDGPGAPGPLAGWVGFGNGAGGEYWIQLTGCVPVNPGPGQPGVWQEAGDAPDIVPGQPTAGTGSLLRIFGQMNDSTDVDLYRIRISDPNNFSATTVGGDLDDTQLCLFNLSGNGVAFDDDRPDAASALSQLSGALVPAAGRYFLGVSEFSRSPFSASGSMWLADPAYTERAPDGPGSAGSLAGWSGAGSPDGGYYGVILTGAQFDDGTVGVDDGSPRGSSRVTLETHPNPSRGAVTISYSIPQAGAVRLRILDIQGRLVRTLLDGSRAEPANSLQWDGRDARGAAVATGVYIVRLDAGGIAQARRVVWVGDR